MKIVQFKNGKYGIRKWTFSGYKFLGKDTSEDYWWSESFAVHNAMMTKAEVIDRLRRYPLPPLDYGIVVDLKELQ